MSENKAVNSALRAAMGKHKSHKIGAGNPANKAVNDSIRNKFRGNSSQAAIDRVVESARKKEADQAREAAAKAAKENSVSVDSIRNAVYEAVDDYLDAGE